MIKRILPFLFLICCLPLIAKEDPRIPEGLAARHANNRAWLIENAKREEVQCYSSGLQVEILSEGYGRKPKLNDYVYVYYKGTLIDGSIFQETNHDKDPIRFKVRNTVPGFSEGLQYIRVGSRARFYIPSDLGYGAKGSKTIPPHSVIIFEVDLVDCE